MEEAFLFSPEVAWVGTCSAVRGRVAFAGALSEAEAVAVHLQDMHVMSEPVEQGAGQAFGAEGLGPFVEGQVAGG